MISVIWRFLLCEWRAFVLKRHGVYFSRHSKENTQRGARAKSVYKTHALNDLLPAEKENRLLGQVCVFMDGRRFELVIGALCGLLMGPPPRVISHFFFYKHDTLSIWLICAISMQCIECR